MMGLALATALAACSAQTGNAPTGPGTGTAPAPAAKAITNPPQNHLPKPGHGIHPSDQIGGGVGKRLMVRLGDAALPNGSKIQAINLGIDQILATDAYGNVTTVAQYTSPQVVNVLSYQGGNSDPDRRRQRRKHGLLLADDRRRYRNEHLHQAAPALPRRCRLIRVPLLGAPRASARRQRPRQGRCRVPSRSRLTRRSP